jgi:hypothetical protein
MEEALSHSFPLQVMNSEAMSKLWDIIKEGMLRSRGELPVLALDHTNIGDRRVRRSSHVPYKAIPEYWCGWKYEV